MLNPASRVSGQTGCTPPGVPIFFFVSGFLISASYERSNSLIEYFCNRALRIYPALWLCLAFSIAIIVSFNSLPWQGASFWAWVFAQLSIFQFYNPEFLRNFGVGVINGSLWTIPVELQFYALLPLIFWIIRSARPIAFVYIIGCFALLNLSFTMLAIDKTNLLVKLVQVTVLPWLVFFLFGVLAQRNWNAISSYFLGRRGLLWIPVFVAVSALCNWVGVPVAGNRINPLSAIALDCCVVAAAFNAPSFGPRLLRGNDISYGVYLFHMPIVNGFLAACPHIISDLPAVLGLFATTLVCAGLSWIIVERPALQLKKHFASYVSRALMRSPFA